MDMVDTPRKEIRDMNVMELIEKIMEVTKIAALNLWGTNRERTNIAIDECAQSMKDIRLLADKSKLQDAVDNIEVAFRAIEALTETNDVRVTNKSARDIAKEMLDSESDSDSDSKFHNLHKLRIFFFVSGSREVSFARFR